MYANVVHCIELIVVQFIENLLCLLFFISIFGFEGTDAENILYINWLNMVRAGLLGLEYYTPDTKKWRQVSG